MKNEKFEEDADSAAGSSAADGDTKPSPGTNENGYPKAPDALYSDSNVYSYDFMAGQPDMEVTQLPDMQGILDGDGRVDRGKARSEGMKNAGAAGDVRDNGAYVPNSYTGHEIKVTNRTPLHSINGDVRRMLTNARLGAVVGDLVKRAIPVNALKGMNRQDVLGTYAMAAYATDSSGNEFVAIITVERGTRRVRGIEFIDVAHSVSGRTKRAPRLPLRHGGTDMSDTPTSEDPIYISIADFLEVVNSTHQEEF